MTKNSYKIDSMAFGAKGIARVGGKVYFIPGTVPGDEVVAEVVKEKKRFAELRVSEWKVKSPLRLSSPCPHSEACGGCQWMEISAKQQLDWKMESLRSSLSKMGKLDEEIDLEVWSAESSHVMTHTGWRNRIRLRVRPSCGGPLEVGFLSRNSKDLVPIDNCIIASSGIRAFLTDWHQAPPSFDISAQMEIQEVCDDDGPKVLVTILVDRGLNEQYSERLVDYCDRLPSVVWAGTRKKGATAPFFCIEEHLGIRFFVKPGQFYQVNLAENQKLREEVWHFTRKLGAQTILDAYCGSGNLSLALGGEGRKILGVESNPVSIDAAKYSVRYNHLGEGFEYRCEDAARSLQGMVKNGRMFDLVLLDPPREGLGDALHSVLNIGACGIVLIGCEPNHFARDLGKLTREGYRIEKMIMADFFPGSYHLESIAFLVRSDARF